MLKKVDKRFVIICAIILALTIMFVSIGMSVSKAKKKSTTEELGKISSETVQSSESISENDIVVSNMESAFDTDIASDSDDIIMPIDCNQDFWAVKYGIAECYDHIFKKGHMRENVYYQGECEEHEPVEINELARQVKLYRDDNGSYSAVLPEIGWTINLYDEKIKSIIDAQIEDNGRIYSLDEVSIVMYFTDNTLFIESVNEE